MYVIELKCTTELKSKYIEVGIPKFYLGIKYQIKNLLCKNIVSP